MDREDAVKGLRNVADWHYGKYEQTGEEDYLNDGDFLTAVANMLKAQEPRVIKVQSGGTTMTCKWLSDEFSAICVNAACPACADACPCLNYQEICRYSDNNDEPKEG